MLANVYMVFRKYSRQNKFITVVKYALQNKYKISTILSNCKMYM